MKDLCRCPKHFLPTFEKVPVHYQQRKSKQHIHTERSDLKGILRFAQDDPKKRGHFTSIILPTRVAFVETIRKR